MPLHLTLFTKKDNLKQRLGVDTVAVTVALRFGLGRNGAQKGRI